jgi:hypothetical protein
MSTAPPFILWVWKFELPFDPPPSPRSSSFVGGAALTTNSNGTQSAHKGVGGGLDAILMSWMVIIRCNLQARDNMRKMRQKNSIWVLTHHILCTVHTLWYGNMGGGGNIKNIVQVLRLRLREGKPIEVRLHCSAKFKDWFILMPHRFRQMKMMMPRFLYDTTPAPAPHHCFTKIVQLNFTHIKDTFRGPPFFNIAVPHLRPEVTKVQR